MKLGQMQLKGVGVDIIQLSRAHRFLKRHRKFIHEKLLEKSEQLRLTHHAMTSLQFAKLFTAKEAFFKATGADWMGVEGFSRIRVNPLSGNRFTASAQVGQEHLEGEGRFFRLPDHVGAEVILCEPEPQGV